jgi:hypothetical protein
MHLLSMIAVLEIVQSEKCDAQNMSRFALPVSCEHDESSHSLLGVPKSLYVKTNVGECGTSKRIKPVPVSRAHFSSLVTIVFPPFRILE